MNVITKIVALKDSGKPVTLAGEPALHTQDYLADDSDVDGTYHILESARLPEYATRLQRIVMGIKDPILFEAIRAGEPVAEDISLPFVEFKKKILNNRLRFNARYIIYDAPSWSLDDAQLSAKQHPYTFYVPSDHVFKHLSVGDTVQLPFDFKNDNKDAKACERMWVDITGIDESTFHGTLDNIPAYISDLKIGDLVSFERRHICATEYKDPDDPTEPWQRKCYAPRVIIEGKIKPEFIYREEPTLSSDTDDSGWCFATGKETQDDWAEDNYACYTTLGRMLNVDDSFIDLLDSPAGSEFVRRFGRWKKLS